MISPTVFDPEEIDYFDVDRQHSHEFYVPVKGSKKRILSNLGPTNIHHVLYTRCLTYLDRKINAVDVGCRDGEFTRYLTWEFPHVYCFDYRRRPFFAGNVSLQAVTHYTVALGATQSQELGSGRNNFRNPVVDAPYRIRKLKENTQDTILPLDSFQLPEVNLIKIDVDGMEEEVLKGAVETLAKYQPVIVIEELIMADGLPNHDGIKFLSDLGYEEVFKIESQKTHRDYIFVKK
jgi:FkbM family methyltransferase